MINLTCLIFTLKKLNLLALQQLKEFSKTKAIIANYTMHVRVNQNSLHIRLTVGNKEGFYWRGSLELHDIGHLLHVDIQ